MTFDPTINEARRNLLLLSAAGAAGLGLATASTAAQAQGLQAGDQGSVLDKILKSGELKIGYGLNVPWFYKDLKNQSFKGIYYDLTQDLARDLEVKPVYTEVTYANATIALQNGEFDLFGSTLVYTPPRAVAINYVGPLWSRGFLATTHKDFADRFKSVDDFNQPDVIFSVNAGGADVGVVQTLFPQAQVIATTGQHALALEPVRAKKAHLYITGDNDAIVAARKNSDWAVVVDPERPFAKKINTWAIRYGDPTWESFLNTWIQNAIRSERVSQLYNDYIALEDY